jgi:hypothetical protein
MRGGRIRSTEKRKLTAISVKVYGKLLIFLFDWQKAIVHEMLKKWYLVY